MTSMILYAALGAVGAGLFVITFVLGRNPPAKRPEFGTRGLKRSASMSKGGLFALTEPAVRLIAGWLEGLPAPGLKEKMRIAVQHSGEHHGLSPNEALATCILGGVAGAVAGLAAVYAVDFPTITVMAVMIFGIISPYMNMQSVAAERFKSIHRSLPPAIDMAALCMGAGLDFPGALKQIAEKSPDSAAALVEEVNRILQELDLGHTRRKALEGFAERCPTNAVLDFVGTVVQAEAKGTPLAEVLSIQAGTLRQKRSVAAEESAAKAGLMMMGPLMLMFLVVIMLLMGPFVIRLSGTGL